MPFHIVRNDIVAMQTDAIVNTANPRPVIGAGTDSAIHTAAGPELLRAREVIGRIQPGEARITPGFRLPARSVIHTVGPVWQGGGQQEEQILRRCYRSSLELALKSSCRSVAFPLISTGTYGFPKPLALQIAVQEFSRFLTAEDMDLYLVVFNRDAYQLSEKLMGSVASYIDETYVGAKEKEEQACPMPFLRSSRYRDAAEFREIREYPPCAVSDVNGADLQEPLQNLLRQRDAGFSETLVALIDRSGKKNSEVYKKANVDKKLFSKIINNINYHPAKATAVAFAVALELDWERAKDLISRAGYSMTHSSKFDMIIEYFLLHHNYDIFEINETLFEFDQPLLGC